MSSPTSLFNGFAIMVVGILISVMLMSTVGQIGDRVIVTLADIGMFEVNQDWQDSTDSIYTFQSFLFMLCLLPGILGVITCILSAVKRQRYDVGVEPQIDYTPQYGGGR